MRQERVDRKPRKRTARRRAARRRDAATPLIYAPRVSTATARDVIARIDDLLGSRGAGEDGC